jgi:hypothetical protein
MGPTFGLGVMLTGIVEPLRDVAADERGVVCPWELEPAPFPGTLSDVPVVFDSVVPAPVCGASFGIWKFNIATSSVIAVAGTAASGSSSLKASVWSGRNSTPPYKL